MYTIQKLQEVLGKTIIKLDGDYVLETHRGAVVKLQSGSFKKIGEVSDYSLNEQGTMVVLEKIPPPAPKKKSEKKSARAEIRPTPQINKPAFQTRSPEPSPASPASPTPGVPKGLFGSKPKSTRKDS